MGVLNTEEWPLVGRSTELGAVARIARSRRSNGVLLVGHPGVGRTRMARAALAASLGGPGTSTPAWVTATRAATPIPLGAVAHLLPDLDPGDGSPGRLLVEARRLLRTADGSRFVLAVDDAHLLDATSAVLLHQLATAGDAFLLLTAPTGVPVPEPLFALWKEGVIERIDLPELTRAGSDELVVRVLGGHVDRSTLRRLWTLALGNPLFLRELVEGGLADGSLRSTGELWRWDGPFPLTDRMVEMVLMRAGTLGAAEQDLLRLVAFGQPLGGDVVAALGPPGAVEAVERRGLVESRRRGDRVEVSLAHPMYAEVLRRHSTPLQERTAYRRLVDHLGSRDDLPAADRRRVLAWCGMLGEETDPGDLLAAALAAEDDDPRLAEQLAATAARSGDPAARLTHARTLVRLDAAGRAEAVLAALEDDLATAGVPPLRREAATVRVRNLYWGLGDVDGVVEVVDALADDPDADALRAFALLLSGRDEEAAALVDDDAVAGADPAAVATAAMAEVRCGRPVRAAELAGRGLVGGSDPTGGWLRFELITVRWFAALQAGDLAAADDLATGCHEEALAAGHRERVALYATFRGIVAARRGRLRTATRWFYEAAAGVSAARFPFAVPLVSELAVALAGLGELSRAREVFAEATGRESVGLLAGWREPTRVWLAGVAGRTSEAERIALGAADDGVSHGMRVGALHTAVRLGLTGAVTDQLGSVVRRDVPLGGALADHGSALAARDAARLDEVAERFADLGLMLYAAEAAAQASATWRAAGRTGSAGGSASRARAWAGRCEGAGTPALDQLDGTTDLTRREAEIASLAATGLTSKAIAAELVVSVRTVDNVLRAVYAKLGVSGRGDLAQVPGMRVTH